MRPDHSVTVDVDGPVDARFACVGLRVLGDPTRRHGPDGTVVFAGRSPAGPVTVRVRGGGPVRVDAWGPGAGWAAGRAAAIAGSGDDPRRVRFGHARLDEVNRRNPGARHGADGLVVDALLARVLGQRVLGREAGRSWRSLCRALGDPAPGPFGLTLPPCPERVAAQPTWWFHEHGVERKRAAALVAVGSHAPCLAAAADLPLAQAYARMRAVPGLGVWTVSGVARVALGDPDAIVVGDYWIPHTVVSFLTDRRRGSDELMLQLVEPWAGQRGRVERLIGLSGHRLQRFGPGRRTPQIRHL